MLEHWIGDVANSKHLVCWSTQNFNCACVHLRITVLFYPGSWQKFFASKNLVTAQTQLHLYSEQQRAFGISNIRYSVTGCSENDINLLFRLKRDRSSWIGPGKWPTDVCPFPQIKPYSPELNVEMWQCPIPPFPPVSLMTRRSERLYKQQEPRYPCCFLTKYYGSSFVLYIYHSWCIKTDHALCLSFKTSHRIMNSFQISG